MTGASDISTDLVSSNQITDYSFVTQPFILDRFNVILRCATGLGPSDDNGNIALGGWYFNGIQIHRRVDTNLCNNVVFEVRGAGGRNYPGVINLYLCGTFTTTEEGVYSCIMMNSSMMNQTMRVGVYLSGRSESLDMYPITSLLTIFHLSTAAPMIDPPSSSTVTVVVGSPLTLSCTSRGSPPDTFTWRKDGTPISPSPSVTTVSHTDSMAVFQSDYTINSVTTSDSGTYTCTVTNPIGSDSETITVNVAGELLYNFYLQCMHVVYIQYSIKYHLYVNISHSVAIFSRLYSSIAKSRMHILGCFLIKTHGSVSCGPRSRRATP